MMSYISPMSAVQGSVAGGANVAQAGGSQAIAGGANSLSTAGSGFSVASNNLSTPGASSVGEMVPQIMQMLMTMLTSLVQMLPAMLRQQAQTAAQPLAQTPGDEQISQLNQVLSGLEPQSAQAQQVRAKIAGIQAEQQGNPQVASLFNTLASMEPESPQAQQIMNQISALQSQQQAPTNVLAGGTFPVGQVPMGLTNQQLASSSGLSTAGQSQALAQPLAMQSQQQAPFSVTFSGDPTAISQFLGGLPQQSLQQLSPVQGAQGLMFQGGLTPASSSQMLQQQAFQQQALMQQAAQQQLLQQAAQQQVLQQAAQQQALQQQALMQQAAQQQALQQLAQQQFLQQSAFMPNASISGFPLAQQSSVAGLNGQPFGVFPVMNQSSFGFGSGMFAGSQSLPPVLGSVLSGFMV